MNRPSWDKYFIDVCKAIATRSHDTDTQVGCVIVDEDHRIVSTGYNGLPPGVLDDNWPTSRQEKYEILKHKDTNEIMIIDDRKDNPEFEKYDTIGYVTKYDVMLHAEVNAIAHAGRSLKGCTLYCTYMPCHPCAMAVVASGIKRIVYVLKNPRTLEKGSYAITEDLCKEANVILKQIEDN